MQRRERTRQLIELGGLVQLAASPGRDHREQVLMLYRRAGRRAFDAGDQG
jgi:hypothetical protein